MSGEAEESLEQETAEEEGPEAPGESPASPLEGETKPAEGEAGEAKKVSDAEAAGKPAQPDPLDQLYKITLDKEEKEVPLRELVESYELAQVSRKRFQEAAAFSRGAQGAVKMLVENPAETAIQILTGNLGGDREQAESLIEERVKQWLIPRLKARMDEESMSEEQRRALHVERAYQRKMEELKVREAEIEQARAQAERERAMKSADKQIAAAFQKLDLPAEPEICDMVLREMLRHIDAGEELTFEEAAANVKQRLEEELPKLVTKLSPEQLLKADPKFLERLGNMAKQKARSSNQPGAARAPGARPGASNQSQRRDGAKPVTYDDVFAHNF